MPGSPARSWRNKFSSVERRLRGASRTVGSMGRAVLSIAPMSFPGGLPQRDTNYLVRAEPPQDRLSSTAKRASEGASLHAKDSRLLPVVLDPSDRSGIKELLQPFDLVKALALRSWTGRFVDALKRPFHSRKISQDVRGLRGRFPHWVHRLAESLALLCSGLLDIVANRSDGNISCSGLTKDPIRLFIRNGSSKNDCLARKCGTFKPRLC